MLAVELADVGLGAIIATIITSGAAVFLDHRRRRDEENNRFYDDKRRAYKDFLQCMDLAFHNLRLSAVVLPAIKRLLEGIDADPADIQQVDQLNASMEQSLPILRERMTDGTNELSLLAPKSSIAAGQKMLDIVKRAGKSIDDNGHAGSEDLEAEYLRARDEFQEQARRDLGIKR